MRNRIITYLSYGLLAAGAGIGIYALAKIYLVRRTLPAGTCPVTSNRPLLYLAIGLCCIAFVLSFFERKEKRGNE